MLGTQTKNEMEETDREREIDREREGGKRLAIIHGRIKNVIYSS